MIVLLLELIVELHVYMKICDIILIIFSASDAIIVFFRLIFVDLFCFNSLLLTSLPVWLLFNKNVIFNSKKFIRTVETSFLLHLLVSLQSTSDTFGALYDEHISPSSSDHVTHSP